MGPLISGKSRLVKYYNLARNGLMFMVNVGKSTIHGSFRFIVYNFKIISSLEFSLFLLFYKSVPSSFGSVTLENLKVFSSKEIPYLCLWVPAPHVSRFIPNRFRTGRVETHLLRLIGAKDTS